MKRRGVTVIELIVSFVVLGVLAGISVVALTAVTARSDRSTDSATLAAAVGSARAVAARTYNRYPTDLANQLKITGMTVQTGASTGRATLSVDTSGDGNKAYLTLKSSDGCAGVVDNIAAGTQTWVRDDTITGSQCSAANLKAATLPTGPTSEASPGTVNL